MLLEYNDRIILRIDQRVDGTSSADVTEAIAALKSAKIEDSNEHINAALSSASARMAASDAANRAYLGIGPQDGYDVGSIARPLIPEDLFLETIRAYCDWYRAMASLYGNYSMLHPIGSFGEPVDYIRSLNDLGRGSARIWGDDELGAEVSSQTADYEELNRTLGAQHQQPETVMAAKGM